MPTKEEWGGDTDDWAAESAAPAALAAPAPAAAIAAPAAAATFQVNVRCVIIILCNVCFGDL